MQYVLEMMLCTALHLGDSYIIWNFQKKTPLTCISISGSFTLKDNKRLREFEIECAPEKIL